MHKHLDAHEAQTRGGFCRAFLLESMGKRSRSSWWRSIRGSISPMQCRKLELRVIVVCGIHGGARDAAMSRTHARTNDSRATATAMRRANPECIPPLALR